VFNLHKAGATTGAPLNIHADANPDNSATWRESLGQESPGSILARQEGLC
jgi:hypothetical protein